MPITEHKIRYLVTEIAKDVVEIDNILLHLNITRDEYLRLSGTRAFKEALVVAQTEWQGATNTHKRVKLKAAAIVEELIMKVFFACTKDDQPLNSKVKALETIAKIGGLGALEPAAGTREGTMGNIFNLQINYSEGNTEQVQLGGPIIDGEEYFESNEDEIIDTVQEHVNENKISDAQTSNIQFHGSSLSSVFASDDLEPL
jgi:hypothetical protein